MKVNLIYCRNLSLIKQKLKVSLEYSKKIKLEIKLKMLNHADYVNVEILWL